MDITEYHYEILNILDERFPKSLRRNSLLTLLSNKDPIKFEREIQYLLEHKLIEKKEISVGVPLALFPVDTIPLKISFGLKITANGIDILRKEKRKKIYTKKRKKVNQPIAFISASFDDNVDQKIQWVRNRADNVGINTLWLKEIYKARPTVEKIDQAISESDCIIQ